MSRSRGGRRPPPSRSQTAARRPATKTPAGKQAPAERRQQRKLPIVPILIGVTVAVLVVAIVLSFGSGEESALEVGEVDLSGEVLPRLVQGAAVDPAVGMIAPEIQGADFNGVPVGVSNDGRAKMVLFLAHWCPACQDEVPVVRDWVAGTSLPDGVDVVSVVTLVDRLRGNYPSSEWLEREEWNVPVILDDGDDSAASAFGLSATPFWVFIDAEGTVLARIPGALTAEALDQILVELTT